MNKTHKLYWLPNALTLGRIALLPFLIWSILAVANNTNSIANRPVLLLVLFVFLCLTDFFDGYFARKFNIVSDFGRMIDPIADKLMVAGSLIALMIGFDGAWRVVIPAIIIIFRDIFISGTREHAANANIILSPTKLAKWKTAGEMLAIFLLLLAIISKSILPVSIGFNNFSENTFNIGVMILWLASFLSIISGFYYIKQAFKKQT